MVLTTVIFFTFSVVLVSCASGETLTPRAPPIYNTAPASVHTVPPAPVSVPATSALINSSPMFEAIGNRITYQGNLLEFSVHASDPENDNLTYTISNMPPGAIFNNETRVFSFIPESAGTYNDILFSVSDGESSVSQIINITVLRVIPPLLMEPSDGILPLVILHYGYPSSEIDSVVLRIKPQYFVINTAQGTWAKISGQGSNVFHDISKYKSAGIKVIGYITAGYEGTHSGGGIDSKWYSLEMNRMLIQDMAQIDGVDGVFIDECSSFPDQKGKAYLKELTSLAHSYGLITWGNVGVNNFDPWFFTDGGFDLMNSTENWHGQDLSKVQLDWGYRISVSGFDPNYSAQDAFNMTVNAWGKGLAYSYVTDSSLGYYDLPLWINEYADLLRLYMQDPGKYHTPSDK